MGNGVSRLRSAAELRFAYADPPYIGCANKYPEKTEVDHNVLLSELMKYDGWALSTHVPGLRTIMMLPNFPEDYRVGAWVKPWVSFKPNVNPAYAWEPVIFYGGRKRGREIPTIRDWVSANSTTGRGIAGAKPEAFCFWVFDLLGAQKGDTLIDMFPGTGAVTEAWARYQERML